LSQTKLIPHPDDELFAAEDPAAKEKRKEAVRRLRLLTHGAFAFRAEELKKRKALHAQDAAKAREAEAVASAQALLSPSSEQESYGNHNHYCRPPFVIVHVLLLMMI
jgi:hypothetical protein